jgi:hypothetical protein
VEKERGPQEQKEPNRNGMEERLNKTDTPNQQVPPYPARVYYAQPYRRDEATLRNNALVYTAFLGAATVALIELQTTTLDSPLRVGVFAFATAMPLLAGSILADLMKASYPINIDTHWEMGMIWVGMLASYIGIVCLFWHFSFFAAFVFFLVSIGAFLAYGTVASKLKEINSHEEVKESRDNTRRQPV